jgi:ribonucleoside-triphosphate reductase
MARKFKLRQPFIDTYKTIKPPFGFNGLGELTYMRTYSRLICPETETYDFNTIKGKNISSVSSKEMVNEKWWQTVRRVVEGTYNIQKRHIDKYGLGWSEYKSHRSAEEMYDRMFNMKFLPPGRGLWAMGTSMIEDRGLFAALNNCAFVSTEDIATSNDESTKPFEFLMDMSMLGVGVGFDDKGAEKIVLQEPKPETRLVTIQDTRESWVESVAILLKSYFIKNRPTIEFDYTLIRPYGAPIKTFGGTSSGPDPLEYLHNQIRKLHRHQ